MQLRGLYDQARRLRHVNCREIEIFSANTSSSAASLRQAATDALLSLGYRESVIQHDIEQASAQYQKVVDALVQLHYALEGFCASADSVNQRAKTRGGESVF